LYVSGHAAQSAIEDGATGRHLANRLPRDVAFDLPDPFTADKLVPRYTRLEINAAGLLSQADLQLVPREPSITIVGPSHVGSFAIYRVDITDMGAEPTIHWTSSDSSVLYPDAEATLIFFGSSTTTHQVSVQVTDPYGMSLTDSMTVTSAP